MGGKKEFVNRTWKKYEKRKNGLYNL